MSIVMIVIGTPLLYASTLASLDDLDPRWIPLWKRTRGGGVPH